MWKWFLLTLDLQSGPSLIAELPHRPYAFSKTELSHRTLSWFPFTLGRSLAAPSTTMNMFTVLRAHWLIAQDTGRFEAMQNRDVPSTYNEITKHFYISRCIFPPPSPKLSRPQALTLRLLQSESYPNPHILYVIYPEIYPYDICNHCKLTTATLRHVLWECTTMYNDANPDATSARWDAVLRSSSLGNQKWAIQQARDAAVRLGLSVPTRRP